MGDTTPICATGVQESADKLQKQVEWLMPFESQYLAAATQVQDLTEERDSLSSAYNTAKEDIAQLLQSQVAAKDEIERLLKVRQGRFRRRGLQDKQQKK